MQNEKQELNCLGEVIQNLLGKRVTLETRTVDVSVNEEYEDISKLIHFDNIEYQ